MDILTELRTLDPNSIGTASLPVKIILVIFLGITIIGLGYWFHTKNQLITLESSQAKEVALKQTFEIKAKKAANLEEYKAQLEEMRRTFGTLLRQLPSKTEIPALIVDVSQTGLASGLEIELFKPGNEIEKDFYAEKPIELVVKGNYHQFGTFASEVAALPRIVTLHDISITPGKDRDDKMTMRAIAKTYRYLDDEEEQGQ
jgi:type IV pilus assembly protein PilO